jgi:hypothetical protein
MMRIPAFCVAAFVLAASQVSSLHGQTAAMSHGVVLSGTIQSPICSSDNFASGETSGDLHGSFFVAFDCRDGSIFGGTWLILVTTEGADGMAEIRGTLRGQVVDGSFERDSDGARIVVRGVALAVTEGTGEYAGVGGGTGSLEATADPEGAPQFVGTIGLTF